MLVHLVALAATLQNCENVKDAYQTQCCGKEHTTPFDANCQATGFGGNLPESCGAPQVLETKLFDKSLAFKTMRAAYRVLLKREPNATEIDAAFELDEDDNVISKKSYNQIENEILNNGVIDHMLKFDGAPNLAGETYVVVGGSGGLGYSAAVALAEHTNIEKVYIIGGRSPNYFNAQKKVSLTDGECQRLVDSAFEVCPEGGCPEIPDDVPNGDSEKVKKVMRRTTCPQGFPLYALLGFDDAPFPLLASGLPNVACNPNSTDTRKVQLQRQECDPMYYGPLNVPPNVYDKIEFITTDVRNYTQVEAAVAQLPEDKPPIGVFFAQLGGSFFPDEPSKKVRETVITESKMIEHITFTPGTYTPSSVEFEDNLKLGDDRLIELTPDRQTSAVEYAGLYDSMQLTSVGRGTAYVQDALYERYTYASVKNHTVMTDAASVTSYGSKLHAKFPIQIFSNYFVTKAISMRRAFGYGIDGGKASAAFGDGIRTPSWTGFLEAPTALKTPFWFNVLWGNSDFNKSVPFMPATQNLVSTEDTTVEGATGPGVYSTFTNKDYDDLFNSIQADPNGGFNYAKDASAFFTPHAQSLMYLHSFLLSVTSDTQPVFLNHMQNLALTMEDTTKDLIDPSVVDSFASVTQFDCQDKRDDLMQVHLVDATTYGMTFADWSA